MGASFGTVHVYKGNVDNIKQSLSNELRIKNCSKDWVSIDGKLFSDIPIVIKISKSLSKKTNYPILSFMLFDSDIIALILYKEGKKLAEYAMNYGNEPYQKNIKAFAAELGFEQEEWVRLRKILKCNDIQRKMDLLEEFFGVCLAYDNNCEASVKERSEKLYSEYIEEIKKTKRIKNKTKLVLTQELNMRAAFHEHIILAPILNDGAFDYNSSKAYKLSGDVLKFFGGYKFSSNNLTYVLLEDDEIILHYAISNTTYRLAEGKELVKIALQKELKIIGRLYNRDIICLQYRLMNGDKEQLVCIKNNGDIRWRFCTDAESISLKHISESCIYLHSIYDKEKDSEFIKLDYNGNVIDRITLPYINSESNRQLILIDNFMYLVGEKKVEKNLKVVLLKINQQFEIVEKVELPKGTFLYRSTVDKENNLLFLMTLEREILIIDLIKMTFMKKKCDTALALLKAYNGILFVQESLSTCCVLNSDLDMISRHRLKGYIHETVVNETGLHILTSTGYGDWEGVGKEQFIRVYRVDRL